MTTRCSTLCLVWTTATLVAAAAAQEGMQAPKPAPQLKKYEPLLGVFEGSGEMFAEPGATPSKWTSQTTAQWALGNFFVEEKIRVNLGEGAPPLVMHHFYGFDADTQSYTVYGASNKGSVEAVKLSWPDSNTLVGFSSGTSQGQAYAERWVTRFGKDGYDMRIDVAVGGEPFHTKVTGKFTRSKTAPASFSFDDARPMVPASGELKKLDGLIGSWSVKGSMTPAPGAPAIPISGTEKISWEMGGSLIGSHTVGDPSPAMPGVNYESFAYYAWDPAHRAYDMVYVSNMGEAGKMEGRFTTDDSLVWTSDQSHMGTPSACRCIQTIKDGKISITSDRLLGTNPSAREFTAEYTRGK